MRPWLVLCLLPAVIAAQSGFNLRPIDRVLEDSLSALTPGVSFTLIVDGRIVYRKSFGYFHSDDRVPIASASKWYSAAVILGLTDRGVLRLDDPVSRYLPSFNGTKAGITLRQLLSHTSGLVSDVSCLYAANSTMAGCVDQIGREPLQFPPGTRFSYGNASMQVAGRMAEVATGKSWRQLFNENLEQKLGMTCTTLDAFGSPSNPVVANGAVSCEGDYLKFLKMLLNQGDFEGRRVLSAAAVAEMTRDQTRGVPIIESIYSGYGALDPVLPSLRYGLGTWRERVDPRTNAAIELGSQGATGFSPWLDTERNIAAVFSTRSSQDAIMSTYVALKEAVHQAVQPWAQRSIVVTNGASYLFGPVAPGEIVTLFGTAIGPEREAGARLESGNRIGNELERTRVLFDGQPAPLLYASWSQISTVVPFFLAGRDRVELQIEKNGLRGPHVTIALAPAAPGIFFQSSDRGVVLNEDGTLNSPSNPARPGSILVLYATGCGATSPATPDGELQASPSVLRSSVSVAVNGSPASILYAGGAPGLIAGAVQVNVRLDEFTKAGDAVPLVLTVAGVASPAVKVSIR